MGADSSAAARRERELREDHEFQKQKYAMYDALEADFPPTYSTFGGWLWSWYDNPRVRRADVTDERSYEERRTANYREMRRLCREKNQRRDAEHEADRNRVS